MHRRLWRVAVGLVLAAVTAAAATDTESSVVDLRSECAYPIHLRILVGYGLAAADCAAAGGTLGPTWQGDYGTPCLLPWRVLAPGAVAPASPIYSDPRNPDVQFTAHIARPDGGANYSLSAGGLSAALLSESAVEVAPGQPGFWWTQEYPYSCRPGGLNSGWSDDMPERAVVLRCEGYEPTVPPPAEPEVKYYPPTHVATLPVWASNACSRPVTLRWAFFSNMNEPMAPDFCVNPADGGELFCYSPWYTLQPGEQLWLWNQTLGIYEQPNGFWYFSAYLAGSGDGANRSSSDGIVWLSVPSTPNPTAKKHPGGFEGLARPNDLVSSCDAPSLPNCVWWAMADFSAAVQRVSRHFCATGWNATGPDPPLVLTCGEPGTVGNGSATAGPAEADVAAPLNHTLEVQSACDQPIQLRLAYVWPSSTLVNESGASASQPAFSCPALGASPYTAPPSADCYHTSDFTECASCLSPWLTLAPNQSLQVGREALPPGWGVQFTAHVARRSGGNYSISGRDPSGYFWSGGADGPAITPATNTSLWWTEVAPRGCYRAATGAAVAPLVLRCDDFSAAAPARLPDTLSDQQRVLPLVLRNGCSRAVQLKLGTFKMEDLGSASQPGRVDPLGLLPNGSNCNTWTYQLHIEKRLCTTPWLGLEPGQEVRVGRDVKASPAYYSAYVADSASNNSSPTWLSVPRTGFATSPDSPYAGLGPPDDFTASCGAASLPGCVWWALAEAGPFCGPLVLSCE